MKFNATLSPFSLWRSTRMLTMSAFRSIPKSVFGTFPFMLLAFQNHEFMISFLHLIFFSLYSEIVIKNFIFENSARSGVQRLFCIDSLSMEMRTMPSSSKIYFVFRLNLVIHSQISLGACTTIGNLAASTKLLLLSFCVMGWRFSSFNLLCRFPRS